MEIRQLDHLVLTVENIETTCRFYETVLGMKVIEFAGGRKALKFGQQKINLHEQGKEFEPKAERPTPGSADLCLLTDVPILEIITHIKSCQVEVIAGPVERTGV